MKLCISGSREFKKLQLVRRFVRMLQEDVHVIVGVARGVDEEVALWCNERGLRCDVYKADWDKLGHQAGPIRNTHMVDAADVVVAFWDGKSRGTENALKKAQVQGKLMAIFSDD